MKFLTALKWCSIISVSCVLICCKKNADKPPFAATINGKAYSFDSLFAWVDTSSASLNTYFIAVGAKNTKDNNAIYLSATNHGSKSMAGDYYYHTTIPYPLPDTYSWLNNGHVFFTSGSSPDSFHLGGNNRSVLSIKEVTGSTITGNFSIVMNPTLSNGNTDTTVSLLSTGQFSMPYRIIP